MRPLKMVLVVVAGLVGCSCQSEPPSAPSVIVVQTVNVAGPGSSTATPTPAGGAGSAIIRSVRVGVFNQVCPDGGNVPANAANTIRVGCVATFTATPKDATGKDLQLPDSAWQAMTVQWVVTGGACFDVDEGAGGNPTNHFNRQVRGEATGTCSVCASVDGIGACAVQVNGERIVKVIP